MKSGRSVHAPLVLMVAGLRSFSNTISQNMWGKKQQTGAKNPSNVHIYIYCIYFLTGQNDYGRVASVSASLQHFFNAPCCSRRPSYTCTAGAPQKRRAILLFPRSFFRGSLKLMCFQMQGSGLSHGPAQL